MSTGAGGTDAEIAVPVAADAGDLLVLFVVGRTNTDRISTPSGFTRPAGAAGYAASTTGTAHEVYFFHGVAGSVADPIQLDSTNTGSSISAACLAYENATGIDVSAAAFRADGVGFGTVVSAPTLTTSAANEIVAVMFAQPDADALTMTMTSPASGTNERVDNNPGGAGASASSLGAYDFVQAAAGSTGNIRGSSTESNNHSGIAVALVNLAVPSAPANPSATANSQTQITVAWDDVSGETGYRVERSLTGVGAWSDVSGNLAAGTVSYANTGLTCNTQYFYRVFAFNGAGDSPASTTVNATTNACAPTGGGNRMGGTGAIRKPPRRSSR
jgi:hypothetical protein